MNLRLVGLCSFPRLGMNHYVLLKFLGFTYNYRLLMRHLSNLIHQQNIELFDWSPDWPQRML